MSTKTLAAALTILTLAVAAFTITLPFIGYTQLALFISAPTTLVYAALTTLCWKYAIDES